MFKITSDIAKYVESKNEKEYIAGLMKLNSTYVKPNQGDHKARRSEDPHTLEEMNRQLNYYHRSVATIKLNTIKNETRTKNDIKKRTKENQALIYELNNL